VEVLAGRDAYDIEEHAIATESREEPLEEPPRVPLGVAAAVADENAWRLFRRHQESAGSEK
jgi:hypothetical protein